MTDVRFRSRTGSWCSIGDWIGANRAGWRRLLKTIRSCARFAFALGMPEEATTGLRKMKATGGKEGFELCADCQNVYCEFGIHDRIVDPAQRARFSAKVAR